MPGSVVGVLSPPTGAERLFASVYRALVESRLRHLQPATGKFCQPGEGDAGEAHDDEQHDEEGGDAEQRLGIDGNQLGERVVSVARRLVHALGAVANALSDADEPRHQSAQPLADVEGGDVARWEGGHERQVDDRRCAVDERQNPGEGDQCDAVRLAEEDRRPPPEERQQEAGAGADCDDRADRHRLRESPTKPGLGDAVDYRTDVGHLDDDDEVRRQRPALGKLLHEKWQFDPES